jgi:predicted secreted Zn-dependent protease
MSAVLLAFLCSAHPVARLLPHAGAPRIAATGRSYRAETQLRFTVDPHLPPLPSDDSRDHVSGHIQIARTYAHAARFTVRVVGKTRAEALQNLNRAIATNTRDAQNELRREEALYDRVTDSGYRQEQGPIYGFPGGTDATNICK